MHQLFDSVVEMLAPSTLSALIGVDTGTIHVWPLRERNGASGNQFWAVKTEQDTSFVVKYMSSALDWIMRATDDTQCRAVTLWQSGMLDRLQPEVDTAIVACARDGDGWAILMHDMTRGQMPDCGYPQQAENDRILSTMAVIHARFWDCPQLRRPDLGLGTLPTIMRATTPSVHSMQKYQAGFERLHELFEPDVAAILRELILDPQPLCDAMAHYPETLLHGDIKPNNLTWRDRRGGKITVLDWQMAAAGLCTIDLGWYLAMNRATYAESSIETYRRHLKALTGEVFPDSEWQTVLDLGLLAGLMRCCCQKVWKTYCDTDLEYQAHVRRMVPHWNQWVHDAARWL